MSVPESECVSDKPIDLRIYSPTVPDLRLVDLPGYIQVTHRKQPSELKQRIRDLCERYLKQPNIILAVSPADVDLANSEALLAGRRNDPMGLRTLGIITKVDMVDPSDAVRILTQNDYPLHLGYVGVMCKAVKGKGSAASGTVTVTESQYFGRHSEFRQPDVSVGVDTLRRRLVAILEESMSRNLGRLVEAVQNELEETRYQVKVQYNDQRVTAESYVADTLDAIKQKFKQFTHDFGKPQVRAKVRSLLESRMLDICAELYWSDSGVVAFSKRATQSGSVWWWSSAVSGTKVAIGNVASLMHILALGNGSNSSTLKAPSSPQPPSSADGAQAIDGKGNSGSEWSDDVSLYWDHRLDKAASILTKSGVGRWTTQMVVDLLLGKVETMVSGEPFTYHPNARQAILDFSQEILRGKYHATIDQVENTIKPFKYEVEVEPFEWDKAVSRTRELIDNEIELCRAAIKRIRSLAPKKQLAEAIKIVNASNNGGGSGGKAYATQTLPSSMQPDGGTISSVAGDGDEPQTDAGAMTLPSFSPKLLSQARAIISLRDRLAILRLRRQAIVSDTCKSVHNKALCPEIFLEVVAEKLTYNAALFINFELLHEFFFQFPRVLDSQIYYAQSPRQAREFANQNPVVRQHLELLDRQRKLEEALAQLRDLMRLQEQQAERG
ncbi:mitochondrial dynamin GTPase Msp1, partial [Spiromyces aspiralis]